MKLHEILTLFDYNHWATERLLDAAARLDPEQFLAPASLSHGGLRGTLVHVLGSERIWRTRLQQGITPPAALNEADFPTLDALRQHWRQEERAMRAYLAGLRDEDLTRTVRYVRKGQTQENLLWHILAHVVNHGTQHRSEAAVLLTGHGQSPADLDLIVFVRERAWA